MQVQRWVYGLVDLPHKIQKSRRPMPLRDATHDVTRHDVERGAQACCPMALVVVRAPLNLAGGPAAGGADPTVGQGMNIGKT